DGRIRGGCCETCVSNLATEFLYQRPDKSTAEQLDNYSVRSIEHRSPRPGICTQPVAATTEGGAARRASGAVRAHAEPRNVAGIHSRPRRVVAPGGDAGSVTIAAADHHGRA